MTSLWSPIKVGTLTLDHRTAMAPMTRSRANADGTPGPHAAEYYRQRASLGLLITEGVQPSADGQGYLATPGIYTDAHIAGWRTVTDAVHAAGGHIFFQLMHVGRMSHPDNTPHGRQPVAPSALAPGDHMFTATGMQNIPAPRALSTDEVQATVADFRAAAAAAIAAGADGVEIHGANGYLVQQFLSANSNQREDTYGGPIAHRIRFAVEVATAVAEEIGADRTAIRLSPGSALGGINEGAEVTALYQALVTELAPLNLAYLHIMDWGQEELLAWIRENYTGTLIVNRPGANPEDLGKDIESGLADIVSIGALALANPDLVHRLKNDLPLNTPDKATFFGGDHTGYTDYPFSATPETASPVKLVVKGLNRLAALVRR
jgi:N-ethylmaleimide reductase